MEKWKMQTYDGSLESAKELVKNLLLKPFDYYYDVETGQITIPSRGIVYKEGASYTYRIPENFEVIG